MSIQRLWSIVCLQLTMAAFSLISSQLKANIRKWPRRGSVGAHSGHHHDYLGKNKLRQINTKLAIELPFRNERPSVWASSRRRCPPLRGQPGLRCTEGGSTRHRHLHPCMPGGEGSGCLRPPHSKIQTPNPPTLLQKMINNT